jgi:hypothetical protein
MDETYIWYAVTSYGSYTLIYYQVREKYGSFCWYHITKQGVKYYVSFQTSDSKANFRKSSKERLIKIYDEAYETKQKGDLGKSF